MTWLTKSYFAGGDGAAIARLQFFQEGDRYVRNPDHEYGSEPPLGAPASNLAGPNFTPPLPAYPSGHAGFGGALFQVLRRFYGTDKIPFTFV